jgi:DNA topoisomerase-1
MSSPSLATVLPQSPVVTARMIKRIKKDPELTASAAGLSYIKAGAPGYHRKGKAPRFYYVDEKGERCRDKELVKRIKSLVLPPAWKNVWISKDTEGHLQATGIDEAGRKQYRYHPFWNQIRNETKYYRLLTFSEALPNLRAQVDSDLRKRNHNLERVSALVIRLMDKTCIRVGNEQYKIKHGSSGLTTLDARCTTVKGKSIRFKFTGKKGIKQDIVVHDAQLARMVQQCKEMPGRRLFQYITDTGSRCSLNATQVNNYIQTHTGGNYSAKDFRTWMGSVTAFEYLAAQEPAPSQRQRTRTINTCLDVVAAHLGNTRAVCKKYYVHPALFRAFETGKIQRYMNKELPETNHLSATEQSLRKLLANQSRM